MARSVKVELDTRHWSFVLGFCRSFPDVTESALNFLSLHNSGLLESLYTTQVPSTGSGLLKMLYLVGLGLADEADITVKGLEVVKRAERVYLEAYTSILHVGKERLVGWS